jgi:hypothetical protein
MTAGEIRGAHGLCIFSYGMRLLFHVFLQPGQSGEASYKGVLMYASLLASLPKSARYGACGKLGVLPNRSAFVLLLRTGEPLGAIVATMVCGTVAQSEQTGTNLSIGDNPGRRSMPSGVETHNEI